MWGWKKEGQTVSGAVVKGGPREVGKMVDGEWLRERSEGMAAGEGKR
jgi:hypothetical protein